jgi:hypothetical protein
MHYQQTIQRLKAELEATFDTLDTFFDLGEALRAFQPASDTWSVNEILEHITLTNHFLMITLRQSRDKVLRRAQTQLIPCGESDLDKLERIADPDAFGWIRPEHMEPTRQKLSHEVRVLMGQQHDECLKILGDIVHGEGALHTVRMSVQDLGRLDMYQWLYFLVQHAKRHVVEMRRIESQFQAQT